MSHIVALLPCSRFASGQAFEKEWQMRILTRQGIRRRMAWAKAMIIAGGRGRGCMMTSLMRGGRGWGMSVEGVLEGWPQTGGVG